MEKHFSTKRNAIWTATFEYIDHEALGVRMTGRDPQGRYALIKEMISDPHQSDRV